jgi:hypothetical protein
MFPIDSFKNSLLKFVEILRRHEIPYHLTGGITGVAYGEPRLTQDIDIVIENASAINKLDPLLEELAGTDFIFTEPTVREAIRKKGMFQLFDSVESLKLDIYPREMVEGELSRSQEVEIFKAIRLPIASRLDAAISKLIWVSKGSHKSRRDFRQIFIRSSEAENEEVRRMANELGLKELLIEVIAESDEIEG